MDVIYKNLQWHLWPGELAEDIHKSEMNLAMLHKNGSAVPTRKSLKTWSNHTKIFCFLYLALKARLLYCTMTCISPPQANIQ